MKGIDRILTETAEKLGVKFAFCKREEETGKEWIQKQQQSGKVTLFKFFFHGEAYVGGIEGTGKAVGRIMKKEFKRNIFTMLGALIVSGIVGKIKKGLDYEKCGGAMMLGLSKVVVKGHGNSKANGFAVCIGQAADAVRGNMVGKISEMLEEIRKAEEAKAQAAESVQTVAEEANA